MYPPYIYEKVNNDMPFALLYSNTELENIQDEFMLKNRYNRVRNVKLIARNGHFFG